MTLTKSSPIIIVGAGVFGLSTSLHLARKGYTDITVFDLQPYEANHYDPEDGCDAASADTAKIYRCSYGDEVEYQDLAFSGRPIWLSWNEEIAKSAPEDLPAGISPTDILFLNNGLLRLSTGLELSDYDKESMQFLEKAGLRDHQHIILDETDMAKLKAKDEAEPGKNWVKKALCAQEFGGKDMNGYFDTSGGLTYADKACTWVQHLCKKAGVKFVFGPTKGKLASLIEKEEAGSKTISGIQTVDGEKHMADLVIVACGGWTPSIVKEASKTLETTGGSVITVKLPEDRQDLWEKYAPENWPVLVWGLTGHVSPVYGGLYSFPRTPKGIVKLGYRGRKWTNYQVSPVTGERVSVPRTRYTEEKIENLPVLALDQLKRYLDTFMPDLSSLGVHNTRVCWYTDSDSNDFLIDYVPDYNNTLFVCSGGSGHGFKFLPVLGKHVVNQLEGVKDQFTPLWRWRVPEAGAHANGLEEGEAGERVLAKLQMATQEDWKWVKETAAAAASSEPVSVISGMASMVINEVKEAVTKVTSLAV